MNALEGIIPSYLSAIYKFAKLFSDQNNKNNSLCNLYLDALTYSITLTQKVYNTNNILILLEEFKTSLPDILNCDNGVFSIHESLCNINNHCNTYIGNDELKKIEDRINVFFNITILKDDFKELYKFILMEDIKEILNCVKEHTLNPGNVNKKQLLIAHMGADNYIYEKAYVETLCMHRTSDAVKISLSDIYICPDILMDDKEEPESLMDALENFICDDEKNLFFIEGSGGYGKSSFVSYLAYNYTFNPVKIMNTLQGRQLIIIQLRKYNINNLANEIAQNLDIMYVNTLSDNTLFVFDGLDELCLIQNLIDGNTIIQSIVGRFFFSPNKAIITTRQTYIDYKKLDFRRLNSFCFIKGEIVSFDNKKRIDLVDLFSEKDSRHPNALDYIRNLPEDKKDNKSIYGSPFMLYLIMSGGINDDEKNNSWKLMYRLFNIQIFNPEYNNGNIRIGDVNFKEKVYQLNCDISYEMFKTKNKCLSLTHQEIKKLIRETNYDLSKYIEMSHGLFSYMRITDFGCVEFVHNHIRDFFLAEKVLRKFTELYSEGLDNYSIVCELCQLLSYCFFTIETQQFIKEAIYSGHYEEEIKLINIEKIYEIFDILILSGGIVKYDSVQNSESYLTLSSYAIENITFLYSTIMHHSLSSNLEHGGYILFFSEKCRQNIQNPLFWAFVKHYLNHVDLNGAEFLPLKSFYVLNLCESNFTGANLLKSKFTNVDVSNSHFVSAELSEARFENVKLKNIYAYKATCNSTKFSYCDLTNADFSYTDLTEAQFCYSDVNGINLTNATISRADFSNALNFNTAIFKNTRYTNTTFFPSYFNPETEPNLIKI